MSDEPKRGRDGREMHPASLANLKPGAGAWQPGDAPHLQHGARSRRPQASPEWSPALSLCVVDLEGRADVSLRDGDGELLPWAVPSVEAVAIQRIACVRMDRFVADREAKGNLAPADLDMASKVGERYHRALEREALTLRSRIATRAAALDPLADWHRRRAAAADANAEETS